VVSAPEPVLCAASHLNTSDTQLASYSYTVGRRDFKKIKVCQIVLDK